MTTKVWDYDSLEERSEIFKIKGRVYTLKEASGRAAVQYRNKLLACTVLSADGRPTAMRDLASVEPFLVSLCLFDDSDRPVDVKTIEAWPNRLQKHLYARAKELSELEEGLPIERKLLEEALASSESPVSFESLRDFVSKLDKEKFAPLNRWLREENGDAKN